MTRLRQHSRRELDTRLSCGLRWFQPGFAAFVVRASACVFESSHSEVGFEPLEEHLNAYLNAAWEAVCPTPATKLVLVCLADHANASGHCWPSRRRIAQRCQLSIHAVTDCIARLERAEHLLVKRTARGNTYCLLVQPLNSASSADEPAKFSKRTPQVQPLNTNPKEPVIDPSKEPEEIPGWKRDEDYRARLAKGRP